MPAALDYESPTTPPTTAPICIPARASWPLMLACVYLPYAWLLLIDYPWSDYRLLWLKLWPALPGLLVGVFAHGRDSVQFAIMIAFSTIVVAGLLFAFRRPRRPYVVIPTAAVVFVLSCLNSWIAHALFRM